MPALEERREEKQSRAKRESLSLVTMTLKMHLPEERREGRVKESGRKERLDIAGASPAALEVQANAWTPLVQIHASAAAGRPGQFPLWSPWPGETCWPPRASRASQSVAFIRRLPVVASRRLQSSISSLQVP